MKDLIDRQAAIEAMTTTLWHYPNECYRNLIKEYEFVKRLAELGLKSVPSAQPEPKWIPVSERLPEEDGDYLVLYHIRSAYKQPYLYDVTSFANDLYKIDKYDFCDKKGQKGWFYCDREYGFCEDDSVTAWMPLPEPYREEGGQE